MVYENTKKVCFLISYGYWMLTLSFHSLEIYYENIIHVIWPFRPISEKQKLMKYHQTVNICNCILILMHETLELLNDVISDNGRLHQTKISNQNIAIQYLRHALTFDLTPYKWLTDMRDIKTLQIDISNIFSLPFYTELDQFCFKCYKVVIIWQTTSLETLIHKNQCVYYIHLLHRNTNFSRP